MSLISPSRCLPLALTFWRSGISDCWSRSSASSCSISEYPMMAFSGVRNSWLMFARNCDMARLRELAVRFLQLFEEAGVCNRDGGLARKGLQGAQADPPKTAGLCAIERDRAESLLAMNQRRGSASPPPIRACAGKHDSGNSWLLPQHPERGWSADQGLRVPGVRPVERSAGLQ